MHTVKAASAVVLLSLVLAGCGSTVRATTDDGTITTRVKTALLNEPVADVSRIQVSTFNGVVTLSGRVKSKEDESKAIAVARTIRGVSDVKSSLEIQP
jgi:osmotically-inducible protein OsmY